MSRFVVYRYLALGHAKSSTRWRSQGTEDPLKCSPNVISVDYQEACRGDNHQGWLEARLGSGSPGVIGVVLSPRLPQPVSYWDGDKDAAEAQGAPYGRQYINIVNLTPYNIRYLRDQSHYYQMDEFAFGDIPAGSSLQCVMDYNDGANFLESEDDKGEAYFTVDGTPYTFAILARTHYPSTFNKRTIVDLRGWNMGVREFEQPGSQGSVNLVITGSESYGFHSNINLETSGPVAWMHHIRETLSDRQLRHVIMPGSHDSGMDQVSQTWLGTPRNTQTQGLNIYEQLKVGTRYFDMRVARLDGPTFWAAHVNDEMAVHDMVGGAGMPWNDVISGLNGFMDDYPGEVVIITLRYLVNILEKLEDDKYWNDEEMRVFFDSIARVNKRCPNLKTPVPDVLMGRLQSENNGGGCVLFFNDGRYVNKGKDGVRMADHGKGIYNIDDLQVHDVWSESTDPQHISEDQRNQYHNIRNAPGGNNSFHVSQWVATPSPTDYSIEHYALFQVGGIMYSDGVMGMDLDSFPTVLMSDYVGVRLPGRFDEADWGWEHKTLAMGLNLLLVSSNCELTGLKHPFYPLVKSRMATVASAESKWNGAILADGTTLDNPPAGFNPWKETVLRAGTVFANGTVLSQDMLVPVEW